jgi:hypothetical protein
MIAPDGGVRKGLWRDKWDEHGAWQRRGESQKYRRVRRF